MKEEKAKDLMMRCPACLNLFPSGVGQMQDGFMACALCGAKYGTDIANDSKEEDLPQTNGVNSIIQEISGIVAELTISANKDTQTRGKQLRKLIEQLKPHLVKDKAAAK